MCYTGYLTKTDRDGEMNTVYETVLLDRRIDRWQTERQTVTKYGSNKIRLDLVDYYKSLSCFLTEALHSWTTDDYQLKNRPHTTACRPQTQQNELASAITENDVRHYVYQQQAPTDEQLTCHDQAVMWYIR